MNCPRIHIAGVLLPLIDSDIAVRSCDPSVSLSSSIAVYIRGVSLFASKETHTCMRYRYALQKITILKP